MLATICWFLSFRFCTCPRFSLRVFHMLPLLRQWSNGFFRSNCTGVNRETERHRKKEHGKYVLFFISSLGMPDSVNISVSQHGCYCLTLNTARSSTTLYHKPFLGFFSTLSLSLWINEFVGCFYPNTNSMHKVKFECAKK